MGGRVIADGAQASRHLRWEFFEERIRQGRPRLEPVKGEPPIDLFIDPGGRRIGARFFGETISSVDSPLEEVAIRPISVDELHALEISTGNPSLFRDFYALCCQIADRIQIAQEPISHAVSNTLRAWAAISRRRRLLSETQQIGLIGELVFLQQAGQKVGWDFAARGWYGPDSQEHDFVLRSSDVEVKTTTREQRIHEISSLQQLLPKNNRPLYLVSIQLTPADTAREAISLPKLVAQVLAAVGSSSPTAADLIRDRLKAIGWEDSDREYYQAGYCLRNRMEACRVDHKFPAILPETLKALGTRSTRIVSVGYSINVEGFGAPAGTRKFDRLFS